MCSPMSGCQNFAPSKSVRNPTFNIVGTPTITSRWQNRANRGSALEARSLLLRSQSTVMPSAVQCTAGVSDEGRGTKRALGRAGIFTPVTLLARTKGWLVTARAPRKPKAASRTWASPNQQSPRFSCPLRQGSKKPNCAWLRHARLNEGSITITS
jgi:hypothetical protein